MKLRGVRFEGEPTNDAEDGLDVPSLLEFFPRVQVTEVFVEVWDATGLDSEKTRAQKLGGLHPPASVTRTATHIHYDQACSSILLN